VGPQLVNPLRDNAPWEGGWGFDGVGARRWVLLVEDHFELGVFDGLFSDQTLKGVEMLAGGVIGAVRLLELGQRPDLDLEHLKGIEHRHGHRVGPLIGEVSTDTGPQPLVRLADVDRLAVVVKEGVDAPAVVPDEGAASGQILERCVEIGRQVVAKVLGLERREIDRVWGAAEEEPLALGAGDDRHAASRALVYRATRGSKMCLARWRTTSTATPSPVR
jgi:hypothetical protein